VTKNSLFKFYCQNNDMVRATDNVAACALFGGQTSYAGASSVSARAVYILAVSGDNLPPSVEYINRLLSETNDKYICL
jgi:hypothetical protein